MMVFIVLQVNDEFTELSHGQARWLLCLGSGIMENWPALGLETLQTSRGSARPLA